MTVSEHSHGRSRWFSPQIELGHMIQAALVIVGIITWALASRNNVDNAQRDIASLKTDMATQFERMQNSQDKTRDDLVREIHNNPAVDEHFRAIEKWMSSQEQYNRDNDTRMRNMSDAEANIRADVEVIKRASNAPIRNAR